MTLTVPAKHARPAVEKRKNYDVKTFGLILISTSFRLYYEVIGGVPATVGHSLSYPLQISFLLLIGKDKIYNGSYLPKVYRLFAF